jgi:hypothetical protein
MNLKLYISSVDYFKETHPNAIRVLDINNFISICRNVPLFTTVSNTKTYYYTNSDIKKEQLETLVKSKLPIYIIDEKIDKRSALYKYCKKNKLIVEQPPTNSAILKRMYPMLSSRSIGTILKHSTDYTKLATTNKLLNSFNKLTDNKVAWIFSADYEDKIFETLDYLMVGNSDKFYKLYSDLINLGESKFKFMVLLYNKLKTLILIKPHTGASIKEIQNHTGLNYYQVKNNVMLAKRYSMNTFVKWFLECGRIERDIKYGKADVDIDLEILILNILKGQ